MLTLALLALLSGEVVDSSQTSFTVRSTFQVSASPKKVFEALVEDVGEWWDPEHTWSGDSKRLKIEAKAGGCFCEELEDGGSVQHLEVVYVDKGRLLRMKGGLGPLQELAVAGVLTFTLMETGSGTEITLDYRVSGHHEEGLDSLAPAVDSVLQNQLSRLGAYVEGK
jgi:uncharacterized protein YndB with AHSA1/START domain